MDNTNKDRADTVSATLGALASIGAAGLLANQKKVILHPFSQPPGTRRKNRARRKMERQRRKLGRNQRRK